jgi:hypothetical protein
MQTKLSFFVLFSFFAVTFTACKDKKNTPEYVTEAFLKAFQALKFDEAAALGTQETASLVNMMTSMMAMVGEKEKPKPEPWEPLKSINCKVVKDTTAVCTCQTAKAEKPSDINLRKRGGKWLVFMTKDELQKNP